MKTGLLFAQGDIHPHRSFYHKTIVLLGICVSRGEDTKAGRDFQTLLPTANFLQEIWFLHPNIVGENMKA